MKFSNNSLVTGGFKPLQDRALRDKLRGLQGTDTIQALGDRFGVSRQALSDLLRGITWAQDDFIDGTADNGFADARTNPSPAKILHIDLEVSPTVGAVYGRWNVSLRQDNVIQEPYILSACAKWDGDEGLCFDRTLLDYSDKSGGDFSFLSDASKNDKHLLTDLIEKIEEADMVVAHNLDGFDHKVLNARVAYWKLGPIKPVAKADTLKMARQSFGFPSKALDSLSSYLGIGRKTKIQSMEVSLRCMAGDKEAFEELRKYNADDVFLLEAIYRRLRAWSTTHPNMAVLADAENPICRVCGSDGLRNVPSGVYIGLNKYPLWQCPEDSCGAYSRGRKTLLPRGSNEIVHAPVKV